MTRITSLLLEVALLLSAALAVIMLIRIGLASFLPIQWYWGGALAVVAAPVLLATALWTIGRTAPIKRDNNA